jgi:hypothetical protein
VLFIKDFKKYDTELSEKICNGSMVIPEDIKLLGITANYTRKGTLYRTRKGTYFFVFKRDYTSYMKILTENEAKSFIVKNDYPKWIELFGEAEEG